MQFAGSKFQPKKLHENALYTFVNTVNNNEKQPVHDLIKKTHRKIYMHLTGMICYACSDMHVCMINLSCCVNNTETQL